MVVTSYQVDYKVAGSTSTNPKPKTNGTRKPNSETKNSKKLGWKNQKRKDTTSTKPADKNGKAR